jgi:hypothetical protein
VSSADVRTIFLGLLDGRNAKDCCAIFTAHCSFLICWVTDTVLVGWLPAMAVWTYPHAKVTGVIFCHTCVWYFFAKILKKRNKKGARRLCFFRFFGTIFILWVKNISNRPKQRPLAPL